MKLYPHQAKVLKATEDFDHVAYYLDMGLGKTFVGSEKMLQLGRQANLLVCQKSKLDDWLEHFKLHYRTDYQVYDLTRKDELEAFMAESLGDRWTWIVGVINYDLVFRRPELLKLEDFTLMLDESSLISNELAKRSRAVLRMKPSAVVLLSGTPTAGRYERLWSQCRLLGWNISKKLFWRSYIISEWRDYGGFFREVVTGYKNVDHLKQKLAEHGAVFLKTDEVLDLPEQIEQKIMIGRSRDYIKFVKNKYVRMNDGTELMGSTILSKILCERQLCGQYHAGKLQAFRDLLDSTSDNLVVFYNFNKELEVLREISIEAGRNPGEVNGRKRDDPEGHDTLLVQYQAGAYGLNLQSFANKIVYFTLPLGRGSCDLWEQSKKRIHRIGQKNTCFYYYLLVDRSIETSNLESLEQGRDYTDYLFEEADNGGQ